MLVPAQSKGPFVASHSPGRKHLVCFYAQLSFPLFERVQEVPQPSRFPQT